MSEINRDLDTTPLPPNNLVAQDPQSAELAGYVRTKTFGRDVREAIARSIELNSTRSKSAEELANETVNVANDLTDRFNQQIGALTEDSEVIDARGGKTTLGQRLDETNTQLTKKANSATTVVVKKVSELSMSELIALAGDETVYLSLDVDVDLVVDTTPIFFTNTKIRTANGSQLIIKNEQQVSFGDFTNYKGINILSENKTTAPLAIRPNDNEISERRITLKEFSYVGDAGYNADFVNIYGTKGLTGLVMADINGRNANTVLNFVFEAEDDWITSNQFSNIFFDAFRRFVNTRVDVTPFNLGSMFGGNLFDNLQGQASSLFVEIANDGGTNRYVNPFIWDIKLYAREVNSNKTGRINGSVRNNYLSSTVEMPPAIMKNNGMYYRLGTFINKAPGEAFLRLKVFAVVEGMKNTYDITQAMDGTFTVSSNSNENREAIYFYISEATNGGKILWLKYRHVGWARLSVNERIHFIIDPDTLITFSESEVSGSLSEPIVPEYKEDLVM